ncbi:MAG: hypothetical protein HDQ93_03755 [Desulfovibrio sp.]|nr:hypothetical protein [Desulfovibrio sp.]
MKWRQIVWWICFIILGICVQSLAPGLDALAVGLLIMLQEEDYRDMLWLLPLFILLQEGMGSRPFGSIIVWYAATIVMFKIGRWLFDTKNFLFMFLLSASLGGVYFAVDWLMAPLQNLNFNVEDAMNKSLTEALFLPFAWRLAQATRKTDIKEDDES